ncbi:uncharacterized protein LAESUDRAFT_731251 [Laetiporus sulphureus 93-53]|uniref:Uncharacterized protein n=1 Tax=Laetiporus sulphureus 93-53 TaxID=1314785 RepID=A0A165BNY7_9APHY|nr:uncharacterized protein LAESUDRAFT_731251 [Laetiporus sulphureus 93-53]KZT01391.1 hypothetical protein LAESUDRAFT_731251 [Laetiporus sulphureus 93-53]
MVVRLKEMLGSSSRETKRHNADSSPSQRQVFANDPFERPCISQERTSADLLNSVRFHVV